MTLRHAQGHPEHRRAMRIFGIDPGTDRTGYGCIDAEGSRHHLITTGAITTPVASFPEKLLAIHTGLAALIAECRPDCVAIENVFYATNARSALKLGHARGVAMLAAIEAGLQITEYSPAEVKRAVVGYGRAEKQQVQQMVRLLLGLSAPPTPFDASDALAVALCHSHATVLPQRLGIAATADRGKGTPKTWRQYRPTSP